MKKFTLLCATSALVIPGAAFAQSTGTAEMEKDAIVITGTRTKSVGGVEVPPTTKTREVLNSEFIQRQVPGQSINEVINQLPGVSFTNNDPFGSAGGSLIIRGFDNSRIAETFDGMPLNDTGNYAIFSNQMLDSELIEQVNVSLGSTDVDSPTAAATGSTVNYRSRRPYEQFTARIQGSYGWFDGGDYFRTFGVVDTGNLTSFGTRAWGSASMATNDNVYGHRGKIYKQQYNAVLYQPLAHNGDFIMLGVHYNQNRNNFFGSIPLRTDPFTVVGCDPSKTTCVARVVGSDTSNRFPLTKAERNYTVARCTINTVARPGLADAANGCGSAFEERLNPSDTGNVRAQSRFTLADHLVLTIDPSFQWVKANGGGTVVAQEGLRDVNPAGGTATPNQCVAATPPANTSCQIGYLGGTPYFGRDLNGDGDRLDTVRLLAPSQTRTNRWGVNASLRYDITETQTVRVIASYDRGLHRQTGETGLLEINGEPFQAFPVNDPVIAANGDVLEKRDRKSIAILEQVGAEYRGEFFDRRLTVNLGVRAPHFIRDLTNNCLTSSASGFVECFGQNSAGLAAYQQFNPTVKVAGVDQPVQGPQHRRLTYNAVLPNVGLLFDLGNNASIFANYSRGLQVPSTDNLYNNFFFAISNPRAKPKPETTDNFDIGARYRSSKLIAQASFWYTIFQNRLASAYDPDLDQNVFRNLGTVHKYGVDASMSYQVIPQLQFYVYGSYLWSRIQSNVAAGECNGTLVSPTCPAGTAAGTPIYALTQGHRESGAPVYTFGAAVQANLGPLELRLQAKRTGPRYVNDINQPLILCSAAFQNVLDCPSTATKVQVYGAKTPAYTTVDLGARLPMGWAGLNNGTYLQFNVTNVFDKLYVGNFGGQLLNTSVPFVQIGAPRAFVLTLNIATR
ncbi:MAG: TonB-dependent receptor [Alphaproteobacteria bacterium]|nr:TonB-dependent receptor [Alphaproteobacteria bacterium]